MKELINLTNPNFPCFDLTFWNSLDIDNCLEMDDVLIADDQFYAKSEHFNKYLLNHIVVDSDGKKFRAIKVLPFASWRKLLPFTAKAKGLELVSLVAATKTSAPGNACCAD